MIGILATVTALLFGCALLLVGNGMLGLLMPVRAQIEGFETYELGLMGSSYFIGFGLGCWLGPWIVQRVGHIRAFATAAALAAAAALIPPLLVDPFAWIPLRCVTGLCFAVLYLVIESWLNERATNENRGRILSIYTIVSLLAMTSGQLLFGTGDPRSFALFSLVAILVAVSIVPIALSTAMAPGQVGTVRLRIFRLFETSPVGAMGCLAVGFANGAFWSLAPAFIQGEGMSVAEVSIFMSVAVLGGAIGQWPLGRLSDRTDRRWTIVLSCAGSAVAGLFLSLLAGMSASVAIVLGAAFGIFALPLYALAIAHTFDFTEKAAFVETSSGLLLIYSFGAVIGPGVAGWLMGAIGTWILFLFTAAVHGLTAAFVVYRMSRRAAPMEKAVFQPVPGATPAGLTLDPRGPDGEASQERAA